MTAKYHVFKTFGITKHFPIKLQLLLIRAVPLEYLLHRQLTIPPVMHWRFLSVRVFESNCTFTLNLAILSFLSGTVVRWRVLIFSLKRGRKILKFFFWVGFASSIKNFGRVLAYAVFNCACKLRWLFFVQYVFRFCKNEIFNC